MLLYYFMDDGIARFLIFTVFSSLLTWMVTCLRCALTCRALAARRVAVSVVVGVGGFGRRLALCGRLSLQALGSPVKRFSGDWIIRSVGQLLQTQVDWRRSPEQQDSVNFVYKMNSGYFKLFFISNQHWLLMSRCCLGRELTS